MSNLKSTHTESWDLRGAIFYRPFMRLMEGKWKQIRINFYGVDPSCNYDLNQPNFWNVISTVESECWNT